jgi:hypothetical protein
MIQDFYLEESKGQVLFRNEIIFGFEITSPSIRHRCRANSAIVC